MLLILLCKFVILLHFELRLNFKSSECIFVGINGWNDANFKVNILFKYIS